ncbi:hypothetical protein BLNAU_6116 [Blattamonas nauphoetae]|uniref:Uncharacterized protein n=1 Tax=Blattamonas nauphoetae TaxID=2049346 RepID=A0ABQ9Y551_9EUKA|nr:hypothetical protein BLNAU_6116 [Blattamonas nauphoetae]
MTVPNSFISSWAVDPLSHKFDHSSAFSLHTYFSQPLSPTNNSTQPSMASCFSDDFSKASSHRAAFTSTLGFDTTFPHESIDESSQEESNKSFRPSIDPFSEYASKGDISHSRISEDFDSILEPFISMSPEAWRFSRSQHNSKTSAPATSVSPPSLSFGEPSQISFPEVGNSVDHAMFASDSVSTSTASSHSLDSNTNSRSGLYSVDTGLADLHIKNRHSQPFLEQGLGQNIPLNLPQDQTDPNRQSPFERYDLVAFDSKKSGHYLPTDVSSFYLTPHNSQSASSPTLNTTNQYEQGENSLQNSPSQKYRNPPQTTVLETNRPLSPLNDTSAGSYPSPQPKPKKTYHAMSGHSLPSTSSALCEKSAKERTRMATKQRRMDKQGNSQQKNLNHPKPTPTSAHGSPPFYPAQAPLPLPYLGAGLLPTSSATALNSSYGLPTSSSSSLLSTPSLGQSGGSHGFPSTPSATLHDTPETSFLLSHALSTAVPQLSSSSNAGSVPNSLSASIPPSLNSLITSTYIPSLSSLTSQYSSNIPPSDPSPHLKTHSMSYSQVNAQHTSSPAMHLQSNLSSNGHSQVSPNSHVLPSFNSRSESSHSIRLSTSNGGQSQSGIGTIPILPPYSSQTPHFQPTSSAASQSRASANSPFHHCPPTTPAPFFMPAVQVQNELTQIASAKMSNPDPIGSDTIPNLLASLDSVTRDIVKRKNTGLLPLYYPYIRAIPDNRHYRGVFLHTISFQRKTAWIQSEEFPDNIFCDLRRLSHKNAAQIKPGLTVEFQLALNPKSQSYFSAIQPTIVEGEPEGGELLFGQFGGA